MSRPSPALFFETISAHQRSTALKGAIDLDVFTAIGEGCLTPSALAGRCGAAVRGIRILCDCLAVMGFLTKDDSGYGLTPDTAAFLDRRSTHYLGGAVGFLHSSMLLGAFDDVAGAVRKGGTIVSEHGTVAPEHPIWVEFARSMGPMMTMPAMAIAELIGASNGGDWKVLDLAAGHGRFGLAIARANPRARIVALDWEPILEVAVANAHAAGAADRYDTVAGSAFDVDFGEGYDIVLITNFLHHFDRDANERLLRKAHAALKPGGRAVTLEFVPDEDRVSPPGAAMFSLVMLATTAAGDAYTFSEYEAMFRNAGFAENAIQRIPGSEQSVIISLKPLIPRQP